MRTVQKPSRELSNQRESSSSSLPMELGKLGSFSVTNQQLPAFQPTLKTPNVEKVALDSKGHPGLEKIRTRFGNFIWAKSGMFFPETTHFSWVGLAFRPFFWGSSSSWRVGVQQWKPSPFTLLFGTPSQHTVETPFSFSPYEVVSIFAPPPPYQLLWFSGSVAISTQEDENWAGTWTYPDMISKTCMSFFVWNKLPMFSDFSHSNFDSGKRFLLETSPFEVTLALENNTVSLNPNQLQPPLAPSSFKIT